VDTTALEECAREVFAGDDLTSVVLVTAFKAGDPLVLSEPAMDFTPAAPRDLFLVKLIVGPGNPGPAGAPSTSPGIGIEVWLPPQPNWNGRIHNIGGLGGYDGGAHSSPTQVGWFYAALTAGSEGAVSASTNSGHTPTNAGWAMNPDGSSATQLWGRTVSSRAVSRSPLLRRPRHPSHSPCTPIRRRPSTSGAIRTWRPATAPASSGAPRSSGPAVLSAG